ncbi:MAG: hypothetical protein ABSC88_05460 [Terracidiphilus sp.]|jgi:hypothetical protein
MKFKTGDSTDSAHCTALKHEFLRCEDAFKDFKTYGTMMIMRAQAEAEGAATLTADETRLIAYKTYNAYARFIHHLYEFIVGAIVREKGDTTLGAKDKRQEATVKDSYIGSHAQRILTGRREAILNGTAPAWENHISAFPEKVPPEFAEQFRKMRNKISGHVSHERSAISLSDFYDKFHKYVYMLYQNCRGHWSLLRDKEFPDLNEITKFSVLIKKGGSS